MLKKFISMFIITVYVFSMTGCGEKQNAADGAGLSATSEQAADGENLSASSDEKSVNASSTDFSIPYQPVSAAGDTFIVQDESTERYGLVDDMGNEILPCKYGDMYYLTVNLAAPKLYLAVQDKGSYGVYDLEGNILVTPYYDKIEAVNFNDWFFVCNHDQYGVIDLEGNEVLPIEYFAVDCSVKGMLAATKENNDGATVEVYTSNGEPYSSFTSKKLEKIKFGGYGNEIVGDGRYSLSGEELPLVAGQVSPNASDSYFSRYYPYCFYIEDNQLIAVNAETEEVLITQPLSIEGSPVFATDDGLFYDIKTGTPGARIIITSYVDNSPSYKYDYYYFTFGDKVRCFNLADLGIVPRGNDTNVPTFGVGPFYDGTAFAIAEDDRLLVIDMAGTIVSELKVPFSNGNDCYFFGDCAVLNNNGYIYVINKSGETIVSDEGYSDVLDGGHYMALKTAEGSYDVVDRFGNIIISSESNITDFEQRQTSSTPNLSLIDGKNCRSGALIFDRTLNNYHLMSQYLEIGTSDTIEGEFADSLFQNDGFLICNKNSEETQLYAVANLSGKYEVRLLPSM